MRIREKDQSAIGRRLSPWESDDDHDGAALAEQDNAPDVVDRMSTPQAQTLVGDVAALTQALAILDQRYRNTPGWEQLAQAARLGWASLATALDVNLGQPDYTVDGLGWRPKVMDGPARKGIIGVLQAEHNLVVRMRAFPNAAYLRNVIDSQRILARRLVPFAARADDRLAARWDSRADTYANLQRLFRPIGGRVGRRIRRRGTRYRRQPPPDAPGREHRGALRLGSFQVLFNRIDHRIYAPADWPSMQRLMQRSARISLHPDVA